MFLTLLWPRLGTEIKPLTSTELCLFFIASKNFQGALDFAGLVNYWDGTGEVTLLSEHSVACSREKERKEREDRMKYSC